MVVGVTARRRNGERESLRTLVSPGCSPSRPTRITFAPATTLVRLETDGSSVRKPCRPVKWERQGGPLPAGIGTMGKVGIWQRPPAVASHR